MFGIILTGLGTFFGEVSTSIGKFEVAKRKEAIYGIAFLNLASASLIFLLIVLFNPKSFVFSLASLPFFIPRLLFESLQFFLTTKAIFHADRSTSGFLAILTFPLLLLVDINLGYTFSIYQYIGIGILTLLFIVFFTDHDFSKKGAKFALFAAVNAVITISLYKYNITNFNSVVGEQLVIASLLFLLFFFVLIFTTKKNPFNLFRHKIFVTQSVLDGIGAILMSFAYMFAVASVISGAKRSFSVLWALFSGNYFFKEKHFLIKLALAILLSLSVILLAL